MTAVILVWLVVLTLLVVSTMKQVVAVKHDLLEVQQVLLTRVAKHMGAMEGFIEKLKQERA